MEGIKNFINFWRRQFFMMNFHFTTEVYIYFTTEVYIYFTTEVYIYFTNTSLIFYKHKFTYILQTFLLHSLNFCVQN